MLSPLDAVAVALVGLLMVGAAALHDVGHPRMAPAVWAFAGSLLTIFVALGVT